VAQTRGQFCARRVSALASQQILVKKYASGRAKIRNAQSAFRDQPSAHGLAALGSGVEGDSAGRILSTPSLPLALGAQRARPAPGKSMSAMRSPLSSSRENHLNSPASEDRERRTIS